jgi:UDP-glucose 4-epimerase
MVQLTDGPIVLRACAELVAAGYPVVAVGSLSNSSRETLSRIEQAAAGQFQFEVGDIRDRICLE